MAISESIERTAETERLQAERDLLLDAFEQLLSEIKNGLGGEYDDGEWFALDKARITVSRFRTANFFRPHGRTMRAVAHK